MKLYILLTALMFTSYFTFSQAKEQLVCGDLLEIYSKKSKHLEFVSCELIENSQKVAEANYKCEGKDIYKVIRYFNKKTGANLSPLGFYCCGWETLGGSGIKQSKKIKLINPDYHIMISIYSGETLNTKDPKKEIFFVNVAIYLV